MPKDLIICTLWVNKAPNIQTWYEYCPLLERAGRINSNLVSDYLFVELTDIKTGKLFCTQGVEGLPVLSCNPDRLDNYKITLVWKNAKSLICGLRISHEGKPNDQEIIDKCGEDNYHSLETGEAYLQYFGIYEPVIVKNIIIYPPKLKEKDFNNIQTDYDYQILAKELNWFGVLNNQYIWQNQFDNEIIQESKLTNVPPKVLKAIIGKETQYWPLWSGKNEVGLIQLSDYGADLVLSWSGQIYNKFCPLAINPIWCNYSFGYLSDTNKQKIKDVFRASLILSGPPLIAAEKINQDIVTYELILACYYEAVAEALYPIQPNWDYVIAAYHSGVECVRSGDICQDGLNYLNEINK